MAKFNNDTGHHSLDLALGELAADGYGQFSISEKRKTLRKFGRNEALANGTIATVWQNGTANEVYLTSAQGNLIDTLSSSSAGDVGRTVVLEGHYWDNGVLVFHVQTVTTNGQNKVTLARPLCRATRAIDLNTGAPAGDISVYEDTALTGGVPTDLTKRHIVIKGTLGQAQSYKASTAVSNKDALIITAITVGVNRQQTAAIDFSLEARDAVLNRGFTPRFGRWSVNSAGLTTFRANLDPPILIPPNHDVRMRAIATANGVSGNATFSGYLAIRQDPL